MWEMDAQKKESRDIQFIYRRFGDIFIYFSFFYRWTFSSPKRAEKASPDSLCIKLVLGMQKKESW